MDIYHVYEICSDFYIGQFNFKGLCLNASNVHYSALSMALQYIVHLDYR